MRSLTPVLILICSVCAVSHSLAAERGKFVDAHEAQLLKDSAQFFGSPKQFIDRIEAADFLEAMVPIGTTYSDAKKKITALLERLELGQRMHVHVFLNEKSIIVSFSRIVFPTTPTVVSLTYDLGFDTAKRRMKQSLVPIYAGEAHRGPPPDIEDIEPEKKPNQPPEPTR